MTFRSLRRRFRQWAGGHDWFEGALIALGAAFFALSALCVYASIVLALHFFDEDSAFPVGSSYLKGLKGFGLVLFPVMAFVTFGVGWSLAGRRLARRLARRLRSRRRG